MSTLTTSTVLPTAVRPWALDSARRDDRLYHRLQAAGFLLFMALVAVVPQIQLPEPPAIPAPPPVPLTELTLPEKVIPPQADTRIPEALDPLIELYTATDRPEEAKKWRAERAKYPNLAPPPREKK